MLNEDMDNSPDQLNNSNLQTKTKTSFFFTCVNILHIIQ